MFQITKPSWLERWLGYLNWDILTWHIYVGDAIEYAIDWVIEKINSGLELAQSALNKVEALASSVWSNISAVFQPLWQSVQNIWNTIDTWWSSLSNWWSAKWSETLNAINAVKSSLVSTIAYAQSLINTLSTQWDSFKANTLPQLASINLVESVKGWILQELSAPINSWLAVQKEAVELFTNPTQWFMKHFEKILEEWW